MSDDGRSKSRIVERITVGLDAVASADLARIMEVTGKGPTDAILFVLRTAARYQERMDVAEARGREGRLEWVESDPQKPEVDLWRTGFDVL